MNNISEQEVETRLSSSFTRSAESIETSTIPSLEEPVESTNPSRMLALAASLTLVALVSALLLVNQSSGEKNETEEVTSSNEDGSPQESSMVPEFMWGDDGSGPATMNCLVDSSPSDLVQRDFALIGSIKSVATETIDDPSDGGVEQRVVATVAVDQWLNGGTQDVVTVVFQRSVEDEERLLVAGALTSTGYLAWECGFTITHSNEAEVAWSSAFSR